MASRPLSHVQFTRQLCEAWGLRGSLPRAGPAGQGWESASSPPCILMQLGGACIRAFGGHRQGHRDLLVGAAEVEGVAGGTGQTVSAPGFPRPSQDPSIPRDGLPLPLLLRALSLCRQL